MLCYICDHIHENHLKEAILDHRELLPSNDFHEYGHIYNITL